MEKIIISLHGKITNKNKFSIGINIFDNSKFAITIFSIELQQEYPKQICNITQYYRVDFNKKIKEFYLYRKYCVKKKEKIEPHIILINYNMHSLRKSKNKYFKKLLKNYKLLNLIIIYYDYFLSGLDFTTDYFLFVHDCFESNINSIYSNLINKYKYDFIQFKKLFDKITSDDGIMVLRKGTNFNLHKLTNLYNEQEEREKIKRSDPNYNALSDESNIIFF